MAHALPADPIIPGASEWCGPGGGEQNARAPDVGELSMSKASHAGNLRVCRALTVELPSEGCEQLDRHHLAKWPLGRCIVRIPSGDQLDDELVPQAACPTPRHVVGREQSTRDVVHVAEAFVLGQPFLCERIRTFHHGSSIAEGGQEEDKFARAACR